MDSRVFSTDKAVLGIMAFVFGLFFEIHLAIWWISRSTTLGDLALLLGMGTVAVCLFSVVGWNITKLLLLLQAGRVSLSEDTKNSGEPTTRTQWWLKTLKLYLYLLVVIGASIGLAGLLVL